jgi:starch phosphorylase
LSSSKVAVAEQSASTAALLETTSFHCGPATLMCVKRALTFAPPQLWFARCSEHHAVMKGAISKNASYFNSHRMMRRYATEAYIR